MNNKEQKKEERHCDGCKIFATMGVHSFHCKIRDEKIVVSTIPTPPKALREEWIDDIDNYIDYHGEADKEDIEPFIIKENIKNFIKETIKRDRERIKEKLNMLNVYYRPIHINPDYSKLDETADIREMYEKKNVDDILDEEQL